MNCLSLLIRKFCSAVMLMGCGVLIGRAELDIPRLQKELSSGRASVVRESLDQALEKDAENPYLQYNRAVAAYAEGRYEEALLDLDRVENASVTSLKLQARFQRGNAEFRLGQQSMTNDVDAALSHWKQSLADYEALIKDSPSRKDAAFNREQVRKLLLETLMQSAQKQLDQAQQKDQPQPTTQRIQSLRKAMEQFHDAQELKPEGQQAEAAERGEATAKDLLAQALAQEGTRKTLANNFAVPRRNEPQVMVPDVEQIREGVQMLEDAAALKPKDPEIAQQLDEGQERLANALAQKARIYAMIEPQIPRVDDKLGILRMGLEMTEKALEQRPNHPLAKQVQSQIQQRLAAIHEQQGDQLSQQAENESLEEQAQDLSQALDHFQQASGLQPQQSQLLQKAQQTQKRLEQALEGLGDQLMKKPGEEESPEAEVTRLEGAEQAFNELQSLNPSDKTAQKAQQVGEQIGKAREKLAKKTKGMEDGEDPDGSKGRNRQRAEGNPNNDLQSMPMDAPPRLDTPGVKSPYQSPAMNRNLRDY